MKNRNLNHSDDWQTPPEFYNRLNDEFNFDHDPCPLNGVDGLTSEWGQRNFVNPPYSRQLKELFVKKAVVESQKGKLCVCLLPVSTSTKLFHEVILPNASDIRFIKGRLKFLDGFGVRHGTGQHDSMVVIFGNKWRSLGDEA